MGETYKVRSSNGPAIGLHLTDVGAIEVSRHSFGKTKTFVLVQDGTFSPEFLAQSQSRTQLRQLTRSSATSPITATWK
jgi:hypothetical protein